MTALIIVAAIIVIILLWAWAIYNGLVRSKVRIDEAWSDITVQLKRRYDLIPNLVQTVKGYAAHEKTVFEDVTKARAQALKAQTVGQAAQADNQFQQAMKSLFAVAEAYPQLRASENFKELQDELTDTEDKIQASRRFYNGAVRDFNTKIMIFPNNMFAQKLGFKKFEFFDVAANEKEAVEDPVKVDFSDTSAKMSK